MGRRRDDPRDQKAKGFPGRRKRKTLSDLDRMERQAERDAKLFVDAGQGKDLQALPIFLSDPRLAAAQMIWREFAPRLDRLHLVRRHLIVRLHHILLVGLQRHVGEGSVGVGAAALLLLRPAGGQHIGIQVVVLDAEP